MELAYGTGFKALPWRKPDSLRNFVPNNSCFIMQQRYSLFIAWRDDVALIFTFSNNSESLLTQQPVRSQVIISKQKIIDVVKLDKFIYFVGFDGIFQILCGEGKEQQSKRQEHLGEFTSLTLCEAFKLSPLKTLMAITTLTDNAHASVGYYIVAVACSRTDSEISADVYAVSWDHVSIGECKLLSSHHISHSSFQSSRPEKCYCSLLSKKQTKALFADLKEVEVLLIGLESGQLHCLPVFSLTRKCAIKPSPRLIYESHWPINGLASPTDGCSIFLALEGGTVLNIFPHSKTESNLNCSALSYKTVSLPYSVRCFLAPKSDLIVVSDMVNTNMVHWISTNKADVDGIPLRGVTAMSIVPRANSVIVSTLHNVFYFLDFLHTKEETENICNLWTDDSLDTSLQLVEEMKNQTERLSLIRAELEEEDCIIKALSAVARAPLLAGCFPIVVKVTKTHEDQEGGCLKENMSVRSKPKSTEHTYQLAVEIENESQEDFSPSLWHICLEIKKTDGSIISWNFNLSRTFSKANKFSASLNVPFSVENFPLPVKVQASLVAELKEKDLESQWLTIHLGLVVLDVSYFFSPSFQPPNFCMSDTQNIATFINQMHFNYAQRNTDEEQMREKALMSNYVIPIAEEFRNPKIILEKLLTNCYHKHEHLDMAQNLFYQSERTVIWLTVFFDKTVQLVIRKSCTSITLSSTNIEVLHSVKLFLSTIFGADAHTSSSSDAAPSNAAHIKAKNLNAILETQSLDEALDSKQLLIIHQDLRNNVSSLL